MENVERSGQMKHESPWHGKVSGLQNLPRYAQRYMKDSLLKENQAVSEKHFLIAKRGQESGQGPSNLKSGGKTPSTATRPALRNITNHTNGQNTKPSLKQVTKQSFTTTRQHQSLQKIAADPIQQIPSEHLVSMRFPAIKERALKYAEDGIEHVHMDSCRLDAALDEMQVAEINARASIAISYCSQPPTFLQHHVELQATDELRVDTAMSSISDNEDFFSDTWDDSHLLDKDNLAHSMPTFSEGDLGELL